MQKYGNSGQWNTYRIMDGHQYAGTGTKEEIFELEKQIRGLLSNAMLPFRELERHLMSFGYQPHNIRKVFENVTGISVEELEMDNIMAINSPTSVPRVCLGWGEAKGGKFDYFFIMPWLLEFGIFGQKGDTIREKVESFPDLNKAREWCRKHCKKYHEFNRAIDIKEKKKKKEDMNWNEPGLDTYAGLSQDGKTVLEFLTAYSSDKTIEEKEAYVKSTYASCDIKESDYTILMGILKQAGPDTPEAEMIEGAEKVDMSGESAGTKAHEIDDMLAKDVSFPANAKEFHESESEASAMDATMPIRKAREHVNDLAEKAQNRFIISYIGEFTEFKEPMKGLKVNPAVAGTKPVEPFNVKVSVVSKFSVMDESQIPYTGIISFAYDGERFYTSDQFKGDNGKKYGFTEDGLEKYITDMKAAA